MRNSLRRLQTDYIDLYWLHIWDAKTPIEETMAALDDLVNAGKVRYIGVSDTPAWKIAEANLIARFRGWSGFVGLQIEYSLLERTVEQELVPMAGRIRPRHHAMVAPEKRRAQWQVHPRQCGRHQADRGAMVGSFLNEKTYAVIDELEDIAEAHQTTWPAWRWPGCARSRRVSSVIIGARRLSQLDDNVRAVDVHLGADELARFDALTKPRFGFPQNMMEMAPGMINGGTTINGVSAPISEYVMPAAPALLRPIYYGEQTQKSSFWRQNGEFCVCWPSYPRP